MLAVLLKRDIRLTLSLQTICRIYLWLDSMAHEQLYSAYIQKPKRAQPIYQMRKSSPPVYQMRKSV